MKEPYNTIIGFVFLVLAMAFAYYTTKEVDEIRKNRDQGLDSAPRFLIYYVCRMKKDMIIDVKLTKGNKGSHTLSLNAGTENSFVMGEVLSNGLSTVPSSTVSSDPIKKGLNFPSFLAGLAGTLKENILAPATSLLGVKL